MNCKDTKKIDIVGFLHSIGFAGKIKGSFVWYNSPFRNERTASFSVNQSTNRWNDFGTGQAGDLVDLVKLIYNTDASGAIDILSGCKADEYFSFSKAKTEPKEKDSGIIIKLIQPLTNKSLIQYLSERKIPLPIARRFTEEAYYMVKDKRYFSIAFRNDKGGYELRNPYYKNCSSPKHYTTFQVAGSQQLNLFEGFFDFLSALAYYKVLTPSHNTIILNSLSNLQAVLPLLINYEKINLFLDNDLASESGQKATKSIGNIHRNTINQAALIYPESKDFNDFLTGKTMSY